MQMFYIPSKLLTTSQNWAFDVLHYIRIYITERKQNK